jgi:hypothetical protein
MWVCLFVCRCVYEWRCANMCVYVWCVCERKEKESKRASASASANVCVLLSVQPLHVTVGGVPPHGSTHVIHLIEQADDRLPTHGRDKLRHGFADAG